MTANLPRHARIVTIGGGVLGTSIAGNLGQIGVRDAVVPECDKLTSGTTWHAAGQLASGGMSIETLIWIEQYTRQPYMNLAAETGLSTGWRQCGHIHRTRKVMKRDANFVRAQGLDRFELSSSEIREKFPLIETKGILSDFYTPTNGRANPVGVSMALAAGARAKGVWFIEGTPVTDVVRTGRRGTAGLGIVEHAAGITAEFRRSHRWEIDVHDARIAASASLAQFYDPKSERVRA